MDTNSSAIIYALGVVVVLFSLLFAVWILVALGRLFSKFGEPAWKAWVPVLNIITLLNLAGLNVAFIAIYLIPGVNSFSPIVTTLAAHQINLRFGKGSAHTVLAFLLFPVWATVLGFGSAVPIGGPPALVPTGRALPMPYVVAPSTPHAAVPASWEPRVTSSFAPPAPRAAPEKDPWAPPVSSHPEVVASPVELSRVREATVIPPTRVMQQFQPAPAGGDGDFEKTVVTRRSTPKWTLQAEGGVAISLAKPSAILGRNPTSGGDIGDAQLIALADSSKTVSKTHARLSLTGETWTIVDLQSTNGVFLVSDSDEEIELEPGVSAEVVEAFRLGDLVLRIGRDSSHEAKGK